VSFISPVSPPADEPNIEKHPTTSNFTILACATVTEPPRTMLVEVENSKPGNARISKKNTLPDRAFCKVPFRPPCVTVAPAAALRLVRAFRRTVYLEVACPGIADT